MTYYEWITYIEDLKDKTITDDIINKINKYDYDYPVDVMNRIVDHFLNVIYGKLNKVDEDLIQNLKLINSPQELTMKINNIKETLKDVNKLLTINFLDEELINYVKESIIKYSNSYIDTIKKHFKGIASNDYLLIINNLKFMEEK